MHSTYTQGLYKVQTGWSVAPKMQPGPVCNHSACISTTTQSNKARTSEYHSRHVQGLVVIHLACRHCQTAPGPAKSFPQHDSHVATIQHMQQPLLQQQEQTTANRKAEKPIPHSMRSHLLHALVVVHLASRLRQKAPGRYPWACPLKRSRLPNMTYKRATKQHVQPQLRDKQRTARN
jgi:hypothetical protein